MKLVRNSIGILLVCGLVTTCFPPANDSQDFVSSMVEQKEALSYKDKAISLKLLPGPIGEHYGEGETHYQISKSGTGRIIKVDTLLNGDDIWRNLVNARQVGGISKALKKRFRDAVQIVASPDKMTIAIRESVVNDDDGAFGDIKLVQLERGKGPVSLKLPLSHYPKMPEYSQFVEKYGDQAQKKYEEWIGTDFTPHISSLSNESIELTLWNGETKTHQLTELGGSPASHPPKN